MAVDIRQILSALKTRLRNDAPLVAVVSASEIGSYLPQDTSYPHITYSMTAEVLPIKGETGYEVDLSIIVYTRYKGEAQVLQIADLVKDALDGTPLTIASGDCFGTVYTGLTTDRQPDGESYTGELSYTLFYGE